MENAGSAANSIEDLNAAVEVIAQCAEGAVTAADEANAMSDHGQRVVAGAVQGIHQVATTVSEAAGLIIALGQRSKEIGQIIQVINDIAELTNLLALNAAIEAARAGEQGRGIAVVADEMRNLAGRTAGATAEIPSMIKTIQSETGSAVSAMENGSRQVEGGVEQANQAMQALQQINGSVKRVVEMIQGIAAATRSQSQATDTITIRVEKISEMAKDNSLHIDQTTHASHDLHTLSAYFQKLVSRFQVRAPLRTVQRVDLGGANKIVLREPAHGMGAEPYSAAVVTDLEVWMVVLAMCNPGQRIHKRNGFVIVGKFPGAGDLVGRIIQRPAGDFAQQQFGRGAIQCRLTNTWLTGHGKQLRHGWGNPCYLNL